MFFHGRRGGTTNYNDSHNYFERQEGNKNLLSRTTLDMNMNMMIIAAQLPFLLLLKSLSIVEGLVGGVCCQPSDGDGDGDGDGLVHHLPPKEEMGALDDIERIPCNSISVETFQERFEVPAKPVILVGCDQNWPAKKKWTFEELAGRFDSNGGWRVVHLEDSSHDQDDRIPWSRVVDAMDSNLEFYVFDNLNTTHGKTLEEDYVVPPFFLHDQFQYFTDFPLDYGPMRWFALGSKNSGTYTHFDPFETDAWNTVVHGMKWWMLFPPDSRKDTDEDYGNVGCDPGCSDPDLSIADYFYALSSAPSKDLFDGGGIRHVFQKEGETLYVPTRMVHR